MITSYPMTFSARSARIRAAGQAVAVGTAYSGNANPAPSAGAPPPPVITAPTNNASMPTGSVSFAWTLDPSANNTNLRICGGPGGTGVCHTLGNNPGDVTASYVLPAETYYISMNSVKADGTQGPWSPDVMITVLPPQPGQAPPPPPPGQQPVCTLPTNPRAGQYGAVDPFFGSQADHDAWVGTHPTCNAPAYMPDNYLPMLPAIPGVPPAVSPWIWYAAAGVVVYGAGYLIWAAMQPKPAAVSAPASASTPASTPVSSRRTARASRASQG